MSEPLITTETYYAIRLPNRRLWDGKDAEGYDTRARDIECIDGVARMWLECADAENQLRDMRGRAEKLGTAEAFRRARVVPFRATVTIVEADPDPDTVVNEPVVAMRWGHAESIHHSTWFRVPGHYRDGAVVWQRRGEFAVAVNALAEPWKLANIADYYAENGGYLEVLGPVVPCLDCQDAPGPCVRCNGTGEVSR